MTNSSLPIIVAEWPKTNTETIRVTLDKYKDSRTIDARVWFTGQDGRRPTRAGLTLGIRHLPDLRRAINKAYATAVDLGLIEDADGIDRPDPETGRPEPTDSGGGTT